ncbi:hypothetical protein [Pontibacillus sp. HMF3514]|uniref:hypothetical protein n=1 Tax=Pontibacillus sp. HMF3514 TaxID=2692425 RepID=UPI00131FE3CC|nr:hypothetical protein [Pontibacillus sp. HMF3514]QHE50579.1 hypothetical protein GS400_00080 [Pontibacillus sp. HMF3514]
MKKWLYPFAACMLIFILASCQEKPEQEAAATEESDQPVQEEDKDAAQNDSNENQDKNQSQNENEQEKENKNEADEQKTSSESEEKNAPKELTAQLLKQELSLGMPMKEVTSLLGEPNQKVTSDKDGKNLWRYDKKTVDGYSYNAPSNRDSLDYESFINKDVQLIVFVGVENNKVNSYSIYYYDEQGVPKNYRKNDQFEKTDTMQ